MNRWRNVTLDLLRGIAILVVVFGHSIQVNLSDGYSFIWSKLILAFQMPLLFFISGYSVGYSFPNRDSKRFIKNKIYRLLIPYFGWAVIHYLIVVALPNDYRKFDGTVFLKELLISDFWFLRMLFVFFVIVWICDIFLHQYRDVRSEITAIVFLTVAIICVVGAAKIPLLSQSVSLWYYLWFFSGYVAFCILELPRVKRICSNLVFTNTVAVVSALLMGMTILLLLKKPIPEKLVAIVFVFGLCIVICAMEKTIPLRFKRNLAEIGKNTLPIYAIHWCLFFSPLFRVDFYTNVFLGFPLWISSMVTAFIWLVLCMLLMKVFRMNRITKLVLLGEHTK